MTKQQQNKKKFKIAFLGNFSVDYCSEVHYKKTLEKMGHTVFPLQEGKANSSDMLNIITNENVDIFFWVHTHGWETSGLEQVLADVKKAGIPVVGYHLDLWMGIERQKDLENDNYWRWMDCFFSVDQLMVDYLNSRDDMPQAFFLPAGVFEDECYIGQYRPEFAHDVIFVGSRGYHPEWPYRKQLIEWLEKTYGDRFAQYGGGGKGTIRGKDLNDLYASAKVVVGDTLCKGFDYPYYLSDRIFETTGRGGFLIHPNIKGIEDLFSTKAIYHPQTLSKDKPQNMKDVLEMWTLPDLLTYNFNDFEYLKYLIDYSLKNSLWREAIKTNGFERTKRDHTYTQRLKYLLEIVQNVHNKFD